MFRNIFIISLSNRTRLIFNDPGKDDLGVYSCAVTDTDGVSSSYAIDEAGMLYLILKIMFMEKN